MPGIVVVGAQWGDEGKGKVVDVFSSQADYVVRYQGGANAGHTLIVEGKKVVLHSIPSGVFHPRATCIIAAGVVLDIEALLEEIRAIKTHGLLQNTEQLLISDSATILLPYHRKLDQAREAYLKQDKIGTTGKGIGPAYEDRASRKAILFGDLFQKGGFLKARIEASLQEKNLLLEKLYGEKPFKAEQLVEQILPMAEELLPYRCKDASKIIYKALRSGKKVLFEGAQGSLLDVLHGTYPYVTSSSTLAGSACSGAGIGPNQIEKVFGIAKAYATRVGSGPFPSELKDETGARLRDVGKEYGSTTGRERRCGWLDLVALKYAIRINGITNLALMKIDVLSGLDEIKVCVAYELDGERIEDYPVSPGDLDRAKPIFELFKGWTEDISQSRSVKDLPLAAQNYFHFIGTQLGIPIDMVSVGPGREQTLWVRPLFN